MKTVLYYKILFNNNTIKVYIGYYCLYTWGPLDGKISNKRRALSFLKIKIFSFDNFIKG